ncbi:hypothetical protein DRQ53_05545 [bacterium]|nr:MAG: hypothetical protein DRQ53_05545 [bacterium]
MTVLCTALLLSVLLLTASPAAADSVFGFSYFGREVLTGDARIEGRAGMGLAYTDSMNASVLQATQLADLERVTIGLTGRFSAVNAKEGIGDINRLGMSVPVIRMGMPLPGQGGLGFGFSATRATQWTVSRAWEDPNATPDPDVEYREIIEREGTQFDVPLQVGYRFFDGLLGVGAGMHFKGGAVRIRYDIGERATDGNIISFVQREIRDDTYSGWTPELSLALHDVGPLSIAGYWMPEYEADVDIVQATLSDPLDEPATRTDTMPQRFGMGARLQLPARFSIGADFTFEEWSAYKGRTFTYDSDGNFDPAGEALDMNDERTLRLGLERESVRVGLRYTMPVRLGFYMRDWHYKVQGEDLTEWGVTLGSGLALLGGLSRIDYSIGYSQVGDHGNIGVAESLWTIAVSIAGGERWY